MESTLRKDLWHMSNFVKPRYQVILMIITTTILLAASYIRMKMFVNIDRSPGITTVQPNLYAQRNIVTTGFVLRNFLTFDVVGNEFVADGYVWFEYDSTKVHQKDIEDFSFGKAEIISKSKPYLSQDKNHVRIGYDVKIKFPSNLNYHNFPLDSHRIFFTLNNLSFSADETLFDVKQTAFTVSPSLYINGWQSLGKAVEAGFKDLYFDEEDKTQKKSFPRAIFSIDFRGTSFRDLLLILLPLLVIFFVGLFSIGLDAKKYSTAIASVGAAAITALLSYRFVIETLSPKASCFMLGDHLFNLILILVFMIFLVGTVFLQRFEKYRGLIIVIFHLLLITSWLYLLFIWAMH